MFVISTPTISVFFLVCFLSFFTLVVHSLLRLFVFFALVETVALREPEKLERYTILFANVRLMGQPI